MNRRWDGPLLAILVLCTLLAASIGITARAASSGSTVAVASATGGRWPPAQSRLIWWLDASDASTLFSDVACSAAAAPGGLVRCWTDRRAGQGHLVASGGAPRWSTSPINGHAPVHFSGPRHLAGPDLLGGSTADMQVFVVFREVSRTNNFLWSLNGSATSNVDRFSAHLPWSNGAYYFDPGPISGNRVQTAASFTDVGSANLFTAWKDAAAQRNGMRINRSADMVSPGTGFSAAATTGGLRLGQTGGYSPDHEVAEVLVYDRRLTAAEQAAAEDYLRTKWGTP